MYSFPRLIALLFWLFGEAICLKLSCPLRDVYYERPFHFQNASALKFLALLSSINPHTFFCEMVYRRTYKTL